MGIRGLTTFIENRSHLYLEKYELHSTNIVIDGNAIACQLYKWHCRSNDCFGGDYDKFADVIRNFFQILSECDIIPYIIFDGGYEARKVATVISRMKNKIKSAEQLNSTTEGSISVFPLFLREVFEDIVLKLNIKCVRCDFESDTEVASIARTLNCPVISYDSDFFILDVLYIPFSTVDMAVRRKKTPNSKETYNYINCEIYRVEKFLNSFGGMDKSNLPILAVLLGNDYVKRKEFSLFYQHLKMQKCHGSQSEQQKRIKSLIIWLQNETVESAITKVLSRYKCIRRRSIAKKIQIAIKGYNYGNSDYLKYLEITPIHPKKVQAINVNNIANNIDGQNTSEEEISENNSPEDSNTEENEIDENNSLEDSSYEDEEFHFSKRQEDMFMIFLENFRKCLYPPSFMDILLHSRYYCIPQVENYLSEYSHAVSSEILIVIHRILTNSNDNLVCLARNQNGHVKKYALPQCNINVPSLVEIQNMSLVSRKNLLLKILKLDECFAVNCLNFFPESWQLFIITLKYLTDKSVITWSLVYSLLLCSCFLNYVDTKVGVCRSNKSFDKKFGSIVQNILDNKTETYNISEETILESLENISYDDSLLCLKKLVSYFQIDNKMKNNNRYFDRQLVHSMAQFQSCFLHIKYLNRLLNSPYSHFKISDFYNGTFIYNLTSNFIKRTSLNDYVRILLQDSPSVFNSLKLISGKLKEYCRSDNTQYSKISNKRKRKRKHKEVFAIQSENEDSANEEFMFDPNNKFSLLSNS